MRMLAIITMVATLTMTSSVASAGPKSALDGYQFDGVSSDSELKVEGHTRRQWLEAHPIEARSYWFAWDCKGKRCDSKWNATIRVKAALIKRAPNDLVPSSSDSSSQKGK